MIISRIIICESFINIYLAFVDSKSDRLKPGNPSLQYTIGSYFPIDSGFPHPIGVHPFTSNSPFHPYVRTPSGSSYPMFVEGTRGFAAPLPIPGMSSSSRGNLF